MHEPPLSHGGTDSGPEPRFDFSTNANPLGPCPAIVRRLRRVDPSPYPDPNYTDLRRLLATHHGVAPGRIVVGAGASELILRLVRAHGGPVRLLGPTFSEYERCARLERRPLRRCRTAGALERAAGPSGLTFLCWPNNPTGETLPADRVAHLAARGRLVLDLAYAPFLAPPDLAAIEQAGATAYRLYSPNKAFGLCGLRAAYVITPFEEPSLDALAPGWVLDRFGAEFLAASLSAAAQDWLARCRNQLQIWHRDFAGELAALGYEVRHGPAPFLLVRIGPGATALAARLRTQGIRVRDAASFGLPDWWRLRAMPRAARRALLAELGAAIKAPCERTAQCRATKS